MTPEHLQQIEDLYHSALERDSSERIAFLDSSCNGDEELRREVESLLASHEKAGDFIETPVHEVAARLIADNQRRSMIGRLIGPYEIIELLGAGGMGEVYLAHDPRLDRKVALKLLPDYFTRDEARVRRFQQEARTASGLNHPNILTIHEISQFHGQHFIATEFIDGETLRERMAHTMKPGEALEIATQVAGALAAAHEAGMAHRDIKPENIMIRRDGYVKVLDFGLAKLTEYQADTVDAEAAARVRVKTDPGMVMGTVQYMSPEQARGLAVDGRTDIWSLGVVLCEMVTGRAPFEGETPSHVIVSLLEKEAPPLSRYLPDVPAELERIVSKALRKNRDERYQTVKDLDLDLKSLKQELELACLDRSSRPDARGSTNLSLSDAVTKSSGQAAGETTHESAARTVDIGVAHPTSSAEYIVSEIKRHKRSAMLALATVVIAVAAVVYYFYFAKGGEAIDSVAVIPFVNVSGDPNTEYLSDGISDSIIHSLSQLPNLKKVISLNSVLRYKGKQTDPQMVGRELNVRAVLMGRLVQHGDELSITTELVDVRDNKHLWGRQYNRKLTDIMNVQAEIAQDIAENLRLHLTGDETKRLAKHYTQNAEAYQLYMLGRYYFNRSGAKEDLEKSIEYYEQAIKKDPNYAPAYAGMGTTYHLMGWLGFLPPKESWQKEEWAALKALQVDDTLAEAHVLTAAIKEFNLDWTGAEEEYKRALELDPNSVRAHETYAWHLEMFERLDEALSHLKRAQELDPLSLELMWNMGVWLNFSRQYDRAIEQFQKMIEMEPNYIPAHAAGLAEVYQKKGMYEEAIEEVKKGNGTPPQLGYAYAVAGKKDEALKILDDLKEQSKQRYVSPKAFAMIYMGLGDKDQAFEWFNKTFEENPYRITFLKVDPRFDSLRSDPRFDALLRRMKLVS